MTVTATSNEGDDNDETNHSNDLSDVEADKNKTAKDQNYKDLDKVNDTELTQKRIIENFKKRRSTAMRIIQTSDHQVIEKSNEKNKKQQQQRDRRTMKRIRNARKEQKNNED